jgi:hypothetical protein
LRTDSPASLDTHPLVREYFGQRLRAANPAAHRAAHLRQEAQEIAERGEMRLFLADCALEAARLALAEGEPAEAAAKLAAARGLIKATGYRRREAEADEIMGALIFWFPRAAWEPEKISVP